MNFGLLAGMFACLLTLAAVWRARRMSWSQAPRGLILSATAALLVAVLWFPMDLLILAGMNGRLGLWVSLLLPWAFALAAFIAGAYIEAHYGGGWPWQARRSPKKPGSR